MDTISKARGLQPNSQMNTIGFLIAGVLFVGLLPLLPVFLLYLLVDWITGVAGGSES